MIIFCADCNFQKVIRLLPVFSMALTSSVHQILLRNGSGLVLSTLLADILSLGILLYFIFMVIYPAAKSRLIFRKMMQEVGGPKKHWLWGDVKEVRSQTKLKNTLQPKDIWHAISIICLLHLV